jgi:hypothetical protein
MAEPWLTGQWLDARANMLKRRFFILSCLLAVGAIVCQLTWSGYCGRSLMVRARAASLAGEQQAAMLAESDDILESGRFYPYLGISAALAALVCALVARRRETGPTSLAYVLLAGDVAALFILV